MMRKIIAGFAISLDGYIEGPNGEYDWIIMDKDIDIAAEMSKYDTFLYGRKSYEAVTKMASSFAGYHNLVISSSLKQVESGFTLINDNIEDELKQLKAKEGKDIALYGGAGLLTSLLQLKLVDELTLSVIPVILGSGKPFVQELINKMPLGLKETKVLSSGTVILSYTVLY